MRVVVPFFVVLLASLGAMRAVGGNSPVRSHMDVTAVVSDEAECIGGCVWDHAAAPDFKAADFIAAIRAFAAVDDPSESIALDTLLFHREASRRYLDSIPIDGLGGERRDLLTRELARTSATVEIRMVTDDDAALLSTTGRATVALGEKQHLAAVDHAGLHPHEFNGTLKRVGLHHIWARW